MNNMEKMKCQFKEYLVNIEYLNSINNLLYWDARVGIPRRGMEYREKVMAYVSGEAYKLQTSNKMEKFIDYFKHLDKLDDVTLAIVENAEREYNQLVKIPKDSYMQYEMAKAEAEAVWEEAKKKADYKMFKPHLGRLIGYNKEFIGLWGQKDTKYDTLLDLYEPGITVKALDNVFGELKDAVVQLLDKIRKSGISTKCPSFNKDFPEADQKEFGIFLLNKMGFDFESGRLDESIHPFTNTCDNRDVRLTINYQRNDIRSSIFSCLHEGGHGIYEQDIPDGLKGTMLATGASMGINESQSRFYENIIGRSKEFWKYLFPEVLKRFHQFDGVEFDEFYRGINDVSPSLIRTEADELTYSLHIIIRYELEKEIFNGSVSVDELPALWNKKYKEYLGVEPQNDSEGILQDMHWSGGMFGYFPSYALGNLYGAQFLDKMTKDIPDLFLRIENGDLDTIHKWLNKNIHRHGAIYKPYELLKSITGEELNAKYFINYLNRKYSEIYNLQ